MSTEKNPHDQQCLVCNDWYSPAADDTRVVLCSFCRQHLHTIIQREQSSLSVWGAELVKMIESLSDDDHTRYSRIYHALHSVSPEDRPALLRKINNTKRKMDELSRVLILKDDLMQRQERLYTIMQLEMMI